MGGNTELSTSDSVARNLTENTDEHFDTEEEMNLGDLNITSNYNDCDSLVEEK